MLIIEDGSGVTNANAYVSVAYADGYLRARGAQDANKWIALPTEEREQALVRATDYVERRFGDRFRGFREHRDLSAARSVLSFTDNPSDGKQVTLGAVTYTFQTTVATQDDVLIGADPEETLSNLVAAINGVGEEGVEYGPGTVQNDDASAEPFINLSMIAIARRPGVIGNVVPATTDVTGAAWSFSTLNGGNDLALPQPLSFPRVSLYDADGVPVNGIPHRARQAVVEYAVRATAAPLAADPTTDPTGRAVRSKREKVGPIDVETVYEPGFNTPDAMGSYPVADRLLAAYLKSGGRVFRG